MGVCEREAARATGTGADGSALTLRLFGSAIDLVSRGPKPRDAVAVQIALPGEKLVGRYAVKPADFVNRHPPAANRPDYLSLETHGPSADRRRRQLGHMMERVVSNRVWRPAPVLRLIGETNKVHVNWLSYLRAATTRQRTQSPNGVMPLSLTTLHSQR